MRPNPIIGVVQTDDPEEAQIAEHQSLRDLQISVNSDYATRHDGTVDYIGNRASYSSRAYTEAVQAGAFSVTASAEITEVAADEPQQEAGGGSLLPVIGPPVINADPSGEEVLLREWMKRHPNGIGNGNCAALPQTLASAQGIPLGPASTWTAGAQASGNLSLPRGVLLISGIDANGRYPNKDSGNHVVVLLNHLPNGGLRVFEQVRGHLQIRSITDTKSSSYFLNPSAYYALTPNVPPVARPANKP
jgi:hypothetical protein